MGVKHRPKAKNLIMVKLVGAPEWGELGVVGLGLVIHYTLQRDMPVFDDDVDWRN